MSDSGHLGYARRDFDDTPQEEPTCRLCETHIAAQGKPYVSLQDVAWELARQTGSKLRDVFAQTILNGKDLHLLKDILGVGQDEAITSHDIRVQSGNIELSLHAFQTHPDIRNWLMNITGWRKKIQTVLQGEA